MLLLDANKITTALGPLRCSNLTVLNTSRYTFTIYGQKTPVLCRIFVYVVERYLEKKTSYKTHFLSKAGETDVVLSTAYHAEHTRAASLFMWR